MSKKPQGHYPADDPDGEGLRWLHHVAVFRCRLCGEVFERTHSARIDLNPKQILRQVYMNRQSSVDQVHHDCAEAAYWGVADIQGIQVLAPARPPSLGGPR